MTTRKFWVATAKQAVAVMAATASGMLPAAVALGEFDLKIYLLSVALAGVSVVLKALAASQVNDPESPNFTS